MMIEILRDEEWPPLATARESPRTETRTQHSHKKKKINFKKRINVVKKKKKSITQSAWAGTLMGAGRLVGRLKH